MKNLAFRFDSTPQISPAERALELLGSFSSINAAMPLRGLFYHLGAPFSALPWNGLKTGTLVFLTFYKS